MPAVPDTTLRRPESTGPESSPARRRRRRGRIAAAAVAGCGLAAVLAGCGSSSSGGAPASSPESTAGVSPSTSPSSHPGNLTVGSTSLQKSTLAAGSRSLLGTGTGVVQTSNGLALTAAPNHQTVAVNTDSHGLPKSLEVGLTVTPPSGAGARLLYGIGCDGDWTDFREMYVGATDASGNWEIVDQQDKKVTVVAKGKATLDGGDTQLNLACAEVPGKQWTTRLSFAIDNTIVNTTDHYDKNMPISNSYAVTLIDPGVGAHGSATFHDVAVRSATAV